MWNSDSYRSFIPCFVEIGLAVCEKIFEEFDLLFNGGHLGFGDDLHFNKNEQASPTDHYREVWSISAKRFTRRRRLKSLIKERPFDLSAAILDDVIIWFRQKMLQSDCLVDTFDLIYYMAIFGQKWNFTTTWPLGPCPVLTQGPPYEQIWNSSNYQSFIPGFVEIGQAVCEKTIFWQFDLLFNGGHLGYGNDLHFNKNEQASSTDHYREVWSISAKRFRRRRLKYLIKERVFDLSAAIFDDVVIWFWQKMLSSIPSIRYTISPYSVKNEIWPLLDPSGHAHFWPRGHHMNKSETAVTINHSYQVSSKSAWQFVRRFFKNLTYFSMAAILDLAMTSILTIMNRLHPRTITVKFSQYRQSGSREEDVCNLK